MGAGTGNRAATPLNFGLPLFFHAVEIEVPWFLELTRIAQIGNHIFYR